MTRYCTVAQARAEMASSTAPVSTLLNYALVVSRRIDNLLMTPKHKRPYFAPYLEQRSYPVIPTRVNSSSNVFLLNQNLLSVSGVTIDGATFTSSVSVYPPLQSPFQALQLSVGNSWYYATSALPPRFVNVTGVWGYHSDYTNAWENITTLSAGINSSVTSVAVTLATNLSEGHLIRVDDEYMEITAIATNTLTVKRGQNGTTADSHLIGADVDIFVIEPEVSRIVAKQCGLMVSRIGAYEIANFDQAGVVQYPQDLLHELEAILQEYQYGG